MSKEKAKTENRKDGIDAELSGRLEHVFLAGLGALSAATDLGTKTFDSLVDQGEKYRDKATRKTDKLIGEVQDVIREITDDAQSKASGLFDQVRETTKVDRLHGVFDDRVAAALHRLGVPTRQDVEALNEKLDRILVAIDGKPKARTAKKAVSKKGAVAKKAADKKNAA